MLEQTAIALAIDGLGQVVQLAAVPHWVRLLLAKHLLPPPGQRWVSAPHEVPQTPAVLHVAAAPPGQGILHDTSSTVPQVSTSEFATHTPLQRWNPELQVNPQVPAVQVRIALGWAAQGVQLDPHESTLLLARHMVGLAAGQP